MVPRPFSVRTLWWSRSTRNGGWPILLKRKLYGHLQLCTSGTTQCTSHSHTCQNWKSYARKFNKIDCLNENNVWFSWMGKLWALAWERCACLGHPHEEISLIRRLGYFLFVEASLYVALTPILLLLTLLVHIIRTVVQSPSQWDINRIFIPISVLY